MDLGSYLDVKTLATSGVSFVAGASWKWLSGRRKQRELRAARESAENGRSDAEAKQQKIEMELRDVQRRASSPILALFRGSFHSFPLKHPGEGTTSVLRENPGFLHDGRDGVEPGDPPRPWVYLAIRIDGSLPKFASVFKNGEADYFFSQLTGSDRVIGYRYDPKLYNSMMRFEFRFELPNGVLDTHVYETCHGRRHLLRVDPPSVGAMQGFSL
jgi:hypothetical protein